MENRHIAGLYQLAAFKPRGFESDVVGLPLAGLARGIHQRRPLSVDRSSLPIRVGGIVVGVQHLNLIVAHQENAAISTPLAGAVHLCRRGPLDVQLHVAELLLGIDVTGIVNHLRIAVFHLPGRGHRLAIALLAAV